MLNGHPRDERQQNLWKAFAYPGLHLRAIAEEYSLPAPKAGFNKSHIDSGTHAVHKDVDEYKQVVPVLIFLKHLSDVGGAVVRKAVYLAQKGF